MIFYREYVIKFDNYDRVFRVYDSSHPYETVTYQSSFQKAKTYIDFLYFLKDKVEQADTHEEQ